MIEDVLPSVVTWRETTTDHLAEPLFPSEVEVTIRAVDKRRREFTTVRTCAHQALAALGVEPQPILPDASGAPIWPPGIVGSMTHCDGYRAAVVARDEQLTTLGIDAEPHDQLPPGVLSVVSTSDERTELTELARRDPAVHWDRVLFSAKESLFKAWFPLTRTWIGFEDAHVTLDPPAGTFTGRSLVPGPVVDGCRIEELHGQWTVRNGLILTAVTLTRSRAALMSDIHITGGRTRSYHEIHGCTPWS